MAPTSSDRTTSPPSSRTGAEIRGALAPMLFGFFPAQVLHVAAVLGVADHLAAGPLSTAQLAEVTGTDEPSLYRVLRALACFDVLAETEPGTFAHGPLAEGLLTDSPSSVRHLIKLFAGHEVWRSWGELDETVRTGEPAWDRITGKTAFEYMSGDPEYQANFNRAMAEGSRNAAAGVAGVGDFGRFSWVIDVGGGDGTLLAAVLSAHPHLRGTVFDTPDGLQDTPTRLADAGLADRAATEDGDFFTSVPPGPDAYLIKSVIHDWDDERATTILAHVRAAMGDDGTLLVVEPVMPTSAQGSPDVMMMVMSDLNMLVCTGGKERTEPEFQALFAATGFELVSVTPVPGPTNFSVLEAVPVR